MTTSADSDLTYVAERALAGAQRARADYEHAFSQALAVNVRRHAGDDVSTDVVLLGWRTVADHARTVIDRAAHLTQRRIEAGLQTDPAADDDTANADAWIWSALLPRRFAIGDFVPDVDGQVAACIIDSLTGASDDDAVVEAHLYAMRSDTTTHFLASAGAPLIVTPDVPDPAFIYYVVRRTA